VKTGTFGMNSRQISIKSLFIPNQMCFVFNMLVHARALKRDMNVSQTSWHKEVILGRNSVFRVFRLYLGSSDPCSMLE
jgi:hypothetical protein